MEEDNSFDWEALILQQHDLCEAHDIPMQDRNYDGQLVDVAVALLRNGYVLSTDMTAQLLEEGIDVETLIEMYGVN